MAGISWNSSSINNFFNTSFNSKTSNSIFGSLGDASLIKSGSYKKLMRSYFDDTDTTSTSSSSKSSSTDKTSSSSKSRHACTYTYDCKANTVSTVRNKVLDDLLDKKPKKSTITNSVLDDLLNKNKTTTEDGTVTEKTDATTKDKNTNSSTTVSEATAGAIIDEAV